MNARSYRVSLNLSPLDFPAIMGLGETEITYGSEPHLIGNMVVLNITNAFLLTDLNNKKHNVLTTQSVYQIPCNEIKNREDVSAFYNDAALSLSEAYHNIRKTEIPDLPNLSL